MAYKDEWLSACFGTTADTEIIAKFQNGEAATYTYAVFKELTQEPMVDSIINAETGELLFVRELSD